jgi:NAD(P)-dependent dehydrogenase (short-subunit alcohol dehydrogenase family)
MTEMKGKVAIVTGGGSGLGEAIGKALAKRGVGVVLSDINLKGAERVAGEIGQAGGTASAVQQDTARPEDSERVVRHAADTYGALHFAVNNAGIRGAQAPARAAGRSRAAGLFPVVGRGVVHDGRVLSR